MRSHDSIAINAASVRYAGLMSGAKAARLPLHCLFVRLDPQFALFANLILHEAASERERPRSRRRLRPIR
jgi:hypothetical protein